MEAQEYNGWTNRETWATMLHIDNDEGLLTPILEVAQRHENTRNLADEIESFITEDVLNYDNISTNKNAFLMLTDIGSLYRVNWWAIAQSLLDNLSERVSA